MRIIWKNVFAVVAIVLSMLAGSKGQAEDPTPSPTPSPTTPFPTSSPIPLTPTGSPTFSSAPTSSPVTPAPTTSPIKNPTTAPTKNPTSSPVTPTPTTSPIKNPTTAPTKNPTSSPVTSAPTESPTAFPTKNPTNLPTKSPTTFPTTSPTKFPTTSPTKNPTSSPVTSAPTESPTAFPTENPTNSPTKSPTTFPTTSPTKFPTAAPTKNPIQAPTISPTKNPTGSPTKNPTLSPITPAPTNTPTLQPTQSPTEEEPASAIGMIIGSVVGVIIISVIAGIFFLYRGSIGGRKIPGRFSEDTKMRIDEGIRKVSSGGVGLLNSIRGKPSTGTIGTEDGDVAVASYERSSMKVAPGPKGRKNLDAVIAPPVISTGKSKGAYIPKPSGINIDELLQPKGAAAVGTGATKNNNIDIAAALAPSKNFVDKKSKKSSGKRSPKPAIDFTRKPKNSSSTNPTFADDLKPDQEYLRQRQEKEMKGKHMSIFAPSANFVKKHLKQPDANMQVSNVHPTTPGPSEEYLSEIERKDKGRSIFRPSDNFLQKHAVERKPSKKKSKRKRTKKQPVINIDDEM